MATLENSVIPLLQQILSRLATLEERMGVSAPAAANTATAAPAAAAAAAPALAASVKAFDDYCTAFLNPFVDAATKLGGDAQAGAELIRDAWKETRAVILMSTVCKEPAQAEFGAVLSGVSNKVKAVSSLVKRNEWEKHTKTLSEGVNAVNW
jgi:hypothetical protein